jgi:hypothetical protein
VRGRATATVVGIVCVVLAGPAHAQQPPQPGCEPVWARACSPATAGSAPLEGVVRAVPGLALSNIALMYRTTEGSLAPHAGPAQYGPWQATALASSGAFRLLLPACGAQARDSGCIGGAYEAYAAYRGQPCTEMWYASLIVGEPDSLPIEPAIDPLTCAHPSSTIAPLTGTGGLEPQCKPLWARNCLPGTTGTTVIHGAISRPKGDKMPFSPGHATIAYHTAEANLSGGPIYSATHYLKLRGDGTYTLAPGGCSPSARLFGCDGGTIQAWPEYDHIVCGEPLNTVAVAGEPQTWGISCDNRGTFEGHIQGAKRASWKLTAYSNGAAYKVPVKEGVFATRLAAGNYRLRAQNARSVCAHSPTVKIRIATSTRLTLHC